MSKTNITKKELLKIADMAKIRLMPKEAIRNAARTSNGMDGFPDGYFVCSDPRKRASK